MLENEFADKKDDKEYCQCDKLCPKCGKKKKPAPFGFNMI